jgi:N-acetylmuramoyl-L-alanine amidase
MNVVRHSLIALLLLGSPLIAFETVVIDPGHGGHDEGTSWYKVKEKDLTLSVAKHLENILRDRGIQTVMTRRWDHYVPLNDRARLANSIPDSVLLSIHFNASHEHDISGFESFHFFASPSSRCLAESMQDSLNVETSGRARAVKPQDYAVLSRTHGLAVLVECGFLSNKRESDRLATSEGQEALAKALADGLMRVKPLIDCDPPTTEFARWVINSRKFDLEARKLAGQPTTEPVVAKTNTTKTSPKKKSSKVSSTTPKKKKKSPSTTPKKKKKKTSIVDN